MDLNRLAQTEAAVGRMKPGTAGPPILPTGRRRCGVISLVFELFETCKACLLSLKAMSPIPSSIDHRRAVDNSASISLASGAIFAAASGSVNPGSTPGRRWPTAEIQAGWEMD